MGRALTVGCWVLVAPGLVWATVRLFGLERGPLVQLLAFTPYVAAWSLVPVALALGLRRWWPAGVAAVAAVALIGVVAPRAIGPGGPGGPGGLGGPAGPAGQADQATDTADGKTLRVLTANLLAGRADVPTLMKIVRERAVDVLAVQEFTPAAAAELDRHGLAELMPHRQLNPVVGSEGSGLYSRYPLSEPGIRRNPGGFTQAYATVQVPQAGPTIVESVHPAAPYSMKMLTAWRTDLANQPKATPDGPIRILAGDFNATLDHAPLRDLLDSGYRDAADAAGAGLTGTWGPYDGDRIPPVTIDHVLVDRRIGVRGVWVHTVPGTDHRAVAAELTLPQE